MPRAGAPALPSDPTPPVLYAFFLPTVSSARRMAALGYILGTDVGLGCARLPGRMAPAFDG